jgi:hypothetical protein
MPRAPADEGRIGSMTIYEDDLVAIAESGITFKHYYFPTGGKKVVPWSDIERVKVLDPTIWNGRWRIHGSGDFRTWFPLDRRRPKRDAIFIASLESQWIDIGFTVEDSGRVIGILEGRNLIRND